MTASEILARATGLVGKTLIERYRLDAVLASRVATARLHATDLRGGGLAVTVAYPEYLTGEAGRRFLRDAGTLLMLRHPHLTDTLGSGADPELGVHFIASTLPDAHTLEAVLAECGALDPKAAVRIALQTAQGVSAAHQVGVVHGALSPAALLLETQSTGEVTVRVTDFGCARDGGDAGPSVVLQEVRLPPVPPDYLAPEQLNGGSVEEPADVWGLGAVLYEMLSGSPPFGHLEQDSDVALAIVHDVVPHLQDRAPWVSAELALVVHRALARELAGRYATLEDFASALRPLVPGDELFAGALVTVPSELRTEVARRARLDSSPPPPPAPLPGAGGDELGLIGDRLADRYRVLSVLGRGGMGAVYEVEDELGTRLAAKLISRGLAGENHPALVRFAREAKAASAISSPHVARTLDAGTDDRLGLPYLIMELLRGSDLSVVMKREGALSPLVATRLIIQAARGVAAAHAQNVVHRDIKPANLFLQVDPESQEVTVKVCDFGVAKRGRGDGLSAHMSLTRTGGMLGSPMYMSPEQARNAKHVDGRADIWSLGVVLWEALSGKRLWGQKASLGELIVAICTEPIDRLEDVAPWVSPPLARTVHKALERDLAQRTSSMQALTAALELFAGGSERVTVADLVGLSEEQRERLTARANSLPAPRPNTRPGALNLRSPQTMPSPFATPSPERSPPPPDAPAAPNPTAPPTRAMTAPPAAQRDLRALILGVAVIVLAVALVAALALR